MSKPSDAIVVAGDERSFLKLGLAVVAVAVILYGVIVAQQILAALALVVWLFVVYLAWRFVRAHERLAAAAEAVAAADGHADGARDEGAESGGAGPDGREGTDGG